MTRECSIQPLDEGSKYRAPDSTKILRKGDLIVKYWGRQVDLDFDPFVANLVFATYGVDMLEIEFVDICESGYRDSLGHWLLSTEIFVEIGRKVTYEGPMNYELLFFAIFNNDPNSIVRDRCQI